MNNSSNELRKVIDDILNDIINFTGNQNSIHLPIEEVKSIISERDKNKILNDVNFREVKQAYWEIVDNCESKESYSKLHSAETYLNKGIAVLNEKKPSSRDRYKNANSDSMVAGLTVAALKYRYNNDKSPIDID